MSRVHPHTSNTRQTLPVRERKKAAQRELFLRVSLALFGSHGYDRVRLEDVAAAAKVSVATLYNYFNSKRELLIALLIKDRLDGFEAYEKAVKHPQADPCDGIANLLYTNIDIVRSPADKRLWRELLSAVATSHDRERDSFARNHDTFKGYIARLLAHYVTTGALPDDTPMTLATDIIFGLNEHNLRHLVSCSLCTPKDIRNVTRQQVSLFFGTAPASDRQKPLELACGQRNADGRSSSPLTT
jgi:AcrR family transcriptional regulator